MAKHAMIATGGKRNAGAISRQNTSFVGGKEMQYPGEQTQNGVSENHSQQPDHT